MEREKLFVEAELVPEEGRYQQLLERLTTLAQEVATVDDLLPIFRALCNFIVASVPCNSLFVSLYDADQQLRTCVYAWSEGIEEDTSRLPPRPMNDSPHSRAVATKQVIVTNDFLAALRDVPVVRVGFEADPRPPRASVALPMMMLGRVIGGFEVQSVEPAAYTQAHVTILQMAANLAAIATANVQLLEQERQLRQSAEHSERRFRDLVQGVDAIVWEADGATLRFSFVSQHAEAILGYPVERWLSDPEFWWKHIDPRLRGEVMAVWRRAASERRHQEIEYPALTADGRTIWVRAIIRAAGDKGQLRGLIIDVTRRRRAEEELRESEERYRSFFDHSMDAVLLTSSEGAVRDANPEAYRLFGYTPAEMQRLERSALFDLTDPRLVELLKQWAYTGRVRGELTFRRKDGTRFPGELSSVLFRDHRGQEQSSLIIRDLTQRKQSEREMEAIVSVATHLREAQTLDEMMPIILDQLMDLLRANGAALALHDAGRQETVIELGRGKWEKATGVRLREGEGISGQVIATGQPYLTNEVHTEQHFVMAELLSVVQAMACVPLIAQGRTIGALWVCSTASLNPDDLRILTVIGELTANAIRRTLLHEQTEQRLRRLTALHTIDQTITSGLDLRMILDVLLKQVITHLHVDAADILLLNAPTLTLSYAAGHGFRPRAIPYPSVPLDQSMAGQVVLQRDPIYIPDLREVIPHSPRFLQLQAEGFISCYIVPLIAKGQVEGVLELFHRAPLALDAEWRSFLELLAAQAAIAIDNAALLSSLQSSNLQLALAYDATIEGWSRALDLRDHETEGHSLRVMEMSVRLARAMGISEEALIHVRRGALLHDIGKMGIPDHILLKAGPLTEEEWQIMRRHPTYGYEMLYPIPFLRPALDILYAHHERWDGTGYPNALKGEQIPLAARIFAVVDVWDALRSDRPYRKGWPEKKVLAYIRQEAGRHFDPQVVRAFMKLFTVKRKT